MNGVEHFIARRDSNEFYSLRRIQIHRPGNQNDFMSRFKRCVGDRVAHLAGRAVTDVPDRIDRLAGRASRDNKIHAIKFSWRASMNSVRNAI